MLFVTGKQRLSVTTTLWSRISPSVAFSGPDDAPSVDQRGEIVGEESARNGGPRETARDSRQSLTFMKPHMPVSLSALWYLKE